MTSTSWKEQRANAVSHGFGAVLSAAALIMLLMRSWQSGNMLTLLGGGVFGASLLLLYVSSTLLHSSKEERRIAVYETWDHAAIYLLIAGTYTPFLLALRSETVGVCMLAAVWTLALIGIAMKLKYPGRFLQLSIGQYLLMAWLVVLIIRPLQQLMPPAGVAWLVAGVMLYSTGSIFYFWRQMRYHHAVWHCFVVAGSACHFIAVYGYVMPLFNR
ncbi:hemolysin III family protein [Paenibacillus doosanensis]|uniref:Haemolysin-III related n=1 Tax=Paenibacillus konkukensis TaxID=2020716 RepID=A0ABY4RHD2_9BACL|nr:MULTISPECIES: hemolysin III family protein [Paenibacillus]MCS7464696.1 hemolysin III family protein [Paenibacillus doosanensis]UQZ81548.1 Haemolysin-III related [Paenibacillus konkukensis]